MSVSFDKTVAAMRPEDMELLIRAYIRRHLHATSDLYSGSVQFTLSGTISKRDDAESVRWSVSGNYENTTKGEILSVVAAEFYRRIGWTESSQASLRLLEGASVEDTTEEPDATGWRELEA